MIVSAFEVPAASDHPIAKHLPIRAQALLDPHRNATVLPHSIKGACSRHRDAAAVCTDCNLVQSKILGKGAEEYLPHIQKSFLTSVGSAFPLAKDAT